MAFVLLACAEVRGEKINLELPFEARPTIADLSEVIERVFRFEASNATQTTSRSSVRGEAIEPIFTIATVQIYSDDARQWTELTSPHQLHMYDQLFVVRKYIQPSENARKEIPRPRVSHYFAGRAASVSMPPPPVITARSSAPASARGPSTPALETSTRRDDDRPGAVALRNGGSLIANGAAAAVAASNGVGALSTSVHQALLEGHATPQEVLRVVFEAADKRRHGVITAYDLGTLLRLLSIHVQPDALDEMFSVFAQSGQNRSAQDSVMSFKDFTAWAESYESTVNAMFERIVSIEKERRLNDAQRDSATKISELHRQKQEMEDAMRRLEQDLNREHDRKRSLEDELDELLRERNSDIAEDQVVIDKEVRVQHHRFLLRQEENDFQQVSMTKRRSATHRSFSTGSNAFPAVPGGSTTPGRTGSYLPRQ